MRLTFGLLLFVTLSSAAYLPGQSAANGCNQSNIASQFLSGLFSVPKDLTVIDRFLVDPAYSHNPQLRNGANNLKAALGVLQANFNYIEIQRTATQGYFTFVFSKYFLNFTTYSALPGEPGVSVVDMFRFTPDCKIIEHWNVNQRAVSANQSANGNDMFSCVTCNTHPGPVPSTCDTLTNSIVLLDQLFNDLNATSLDVYVNSQTYIQHNPAVANGVAPLRAFLSFIQRPPLGPIVRTVRGVADGNFVYLFNHYVGSPASAIVDIYRFDSNCSIVEHWDVISTVPVYTASGNDMFSCISCEKNPYLSSCSPTPAPSTSAPSCQNTKQNEININFAGILSGR